MARIVSQWQSGHQHLGGWGIPFAISLFMAVPAVHTTQ